MIRDRSRSYWMYTLSVLCFRDWPLPPSSPRINSKELRIPRTTHVLYSTVFIYSNSIKCSILHSPSNDVPTDTPPDHGSRRNGLRRSSLLTREAGVLISSKSLIIRIHNLYFFQTLTTIFSNGVSGDGIASPTIA